MWPAVETHEIWQVMYSLEKAWLQAIAAESWQHLSWTRQDLWKHFLFTMIWWREREESGGARRKSRGKKQGRRNGKGCKQVGVLALEHMWIWNQIRCFTASNNRFRLGSCWNKIWFQTPLSWSETLGNLISACNPNFHTKLRMSFSVLHIPLCMHLHVHGTGYVNGTRVLRWLHQWE